MPSDPVSTPPPLDEVSPPAGSPEGAARAVLIGAFVLVTAVVAGRTQVHLCDGDAQLYRVVARNIVESGRWLDLTYLESAHARFREHLPFGLWPTAAAIAALGEGALRWLDGLWLLGILGGVAWLARRLHSTWAAAGSVLVLGLMDPLAMYCAFPRLDGSTALFGLLAAAPWLLGVPGLRGTAVGTVAGALACAVKGPFGLVPLVATSIARAVVSRSWRALLLGAGAAIASAIPVAAFLLHQRHWGDASWWDGYVGAQLLSSAQGSRSDGILTPWFPFIAVTRHFWPGLLGVPFAVWNAVRRRDDPARAGRVAGLAFLVGLCILCLPTRKVVHHAVVLYPVASLFVGPALGDALRWLFTRPRPARSMRPVLAGLCVVAWGFVLAGRPPWVRSQHCLPMSPLRESLAELPPGSDLLLITPKQQWRDVAALAAERRITAWQIDRWERVDELAVAPRLAVVVEPAASDAPAGWAQVTTSGPYSLWRREEDRRQPEPQAPPEPTATGD